MNHPASSASLMGSTPKLPKHSEEPEDRLSNLPNFVIGHILSLLPIRNAVGTTILSTKWTDLWTSSIDNLDFDDWIQDIQSNSVMQASFKNFVERVLAKTNSPLHRFSLKCRGSYGVKNIKAWVSAALSHEVRELDLVVPAEGPGLLPYNVFTSRNLEALKLAIHSFILEIPAKICLENLKILHLYFVGFRDDSINRIISSCTMLEDLEIVLCGMGDIEVLNITAPMLKKLVLHISSFKRDWFDADAKVFDIVFDTPRLVYLDYIDNIDVEDSGSESCLVKNLDSLVGASIYVRYLDGFDYFLTELLEGIRNVKSLNLSGSTMYELVEGIKMEELDENERCLPEFCNLTHLMLGDHLYRSWDFLPRLLKSTPKLECLNFYEGLININDIEYLHDSSDNCDDWFQQYEESSFLPSNLREVTISSFQGSEAELKIVEYLLENANVLKKLEVELVMNDEKEELKITKELLELPRASVTCQVVLLKSLSSSCAVG